MEEKDLFVILIFLFLIYIITNKNTEGYCDISDKNWGSLCNSINKIYDNDPPPGQCEAHHCNYIC